MTNGSEAQIRRIVARAKEGDREAFNELIFRYRNRLLVFIFMKIRDYLKDPSIECDDICQEVFIQAWRDMDKFDEKGKKSESSFYSWLCTIAKRCISRERRREEAQKRPSPEKRVSLDEERDKSYEKRQMFWEELESLKKAVERLKLPYREVVEYIVFQQYTINETAERLNRKENTVTKQFHRAAEQIKKMVSVE